LARGGTSHPLLAAIVRARNINQALGGALVGPWDVVDMPSEWIEALDGFTVDMPSMKSGLKKVDDIFAAWRAKHPTYKK